MSLQAQIIGLSFVILRYLHFLRHCKCQNYLYNANLHAFNLTTDEKEIKRIK